MTSIKLFCVLLLGVVASSLAASVEVDERELVELGTPEPPKAPGTDDSDSSDESDSSDSSDEPDERGFWTTSKGEQRCTCDNVSCQCCVSPRIPIAGKIKTCLKITVLASEKSVHLQLSGKDKNLIGHKFNVGAKERMCANVPGSMSSIKGCIDTETGTLPNNAGIQTCPKLELRTVGKTVATLTFACIQYSNRKVSFNNNGPVKASQKVHFKFF